MVRISFVAVCVVVAMLMTLPFAHAFVAGQGTRTYFGAGGACLGPDCAPMGPVGPPMAYQGPMPGPFAAGMPPMPMPKPSKISKCKPPMPACMPPYMPPPGMPMCGPVCPPPCKPLVAWY
jgi:hypothetical protein